MKQGDEVGFKEITGGSNLVKDAIESKVVKQISYWDKNLNKLVEVPKYNNVALGKDLNGTLKAFGDEVGANVWTSSTDKIFTKMYDLPDSYSFERAITSVLNETVKVNGGKVLFDITSVNVEKAIVGGLVHNQELVFKNLVTEFELQMVLLNQTWFDNIIFHEGGRILSQNELLSIGIKLIEQ
ncbi:hypothetical protein JMN32_05815 [Fulvivirga sp. 29W222]|uniref:Uncharacterized protein n=1 Tax=Fulvivirga marina TaxID=2494733 RepID=A0A937FVL7_9BACT|nr:hypothetical protein [Fulvivirga marina]MBL6445813.1 hypothetical protein [Fulvivirga marina]